MLKRSFGTGSCVLRSRRWLDKCRGWSMRTRIQHDETCVRRALVGSSRRYRGLRSSLKILFGPLVQTIHSWTDPLQATIFRSSFVIRTTVYTRSSGASRIVPHVSHRNQKPYHIFDRSRHVWKLSPETELTGKKSIVSTTNIFRTTCSSTALRAYVQNRRSVRQHRDMRNVRRLRREQ